MNGLEFLVVGGYSSFSVSVSGFSGVCVDEDGNAKKVSPFPVDLGGNVRNTCWGLLFLLTNFILVGFSLILLLVISLFWGKSHVGPL